MVFCLPLAHIPSCFTENGHGRGDVNPVDLGEIGSSHAKEFCAQVELWRIPLLFLLGSPSPANFEAPLADRGRVRRPEWLGRSPAPSFHSRHLTRWLVGYSFALVPSACAECGAPRRAPDHCAAASKFASCGSLERAETSSATDRRCAASSATDSPAHRSCVLVSSSSRWH